jgi:hypothetical protein
MLFFVWQYSTAVTDSYININEQNSLMRGLRLLFFVIFGIFCLQIAFAQEGALPAATSEPDYEDVNFWANPTTYDGVVWENAWQKLPPGTNVEWSLITDPKAYESMPAEILNQHSTNPAFVEKVAEHWDSITADQKKDLNKDAVLAVVERSQTGERTRAISLSGLNREIVVESLKKIFDGKLADFATDTTDLIVDGLKISLQSSDAAEYGAEDHTLVSLDTTNIQNIAVRVENGKFVIKTNSISEDQRMQIQERLKNELETKELDDTEEMLDIEHPDYQSILEGRFNEELEALSGKFYQDACEGCIVDVGENDFPILIKTSLEDETPGIILKKGRLEQNAEGYFEAKPNSDIWIARENDPLNVVVLSDINSNVIVGNFDEKQRQMFETQKKNFISLSSVVGDTDQAYIYGSQFSVTYTDRENGDVKIKLSSDSSKKSLLTVFDRKEVNVINTDDVILIGNLRAYPSGRIEHPIDQSEINAPSVTQNKNRVLIFDKEANNVELRLRNGNFDIEIKPTDSNIDIYQKIYDGLDDSLDDFVRQGQARSAFSRITGISELDLENNQYAKFSTFPPQPGERYVRLVTDSEDPDLDYLAITYAAADGTVNTLRVLDINNDGVINNQDIISAGYVAGGVWGQEGDAQFKRATEELAKFGIAMGDLVGDRRGMIRSTFGQMSAQDPLRFSGNPAGWVAPSFPITAASEVSFGSGRNLVDSVSFVSTGSGDHGGASYGIYQFPLSSRDTLVDSSEVKQFVDSLPEGDMKSALLDAWNSGSKSNFDQAWINLGQTKTNEFGFYQEQFMLQTVVPQRLKVFSDIGGLKLDSLHPATLDLLIGTANQYGDLTTSQARFLYNQGGSSLTDAEIVKHLQDFKQVNLETNFRSSSTNVRSGVSQRINRERDMVLAAISSSPNLVSGTAVVSPDLRFPSPVQGLVQRPQTIKDAYRNFVVPFKQQKSYTGNSVVVSVAQQRAFVFDETGKQIDAIPISTGSAGIGNTGGSGKTPPGLLSVSSIAGGTSASDLNMNFGYTATGIAGARVAYAGEEPENSNAQARGIISHTYFENHPRLVRIGTNPISSGCIVVGRNNLCKYVSYLQLGTPVYVLDGSR